MQEKVIAALRKRGMIVWICFSFIDNPRILPYQILTWFDNAVFCLKELLVFRILFFGEIHSWVQSLWNGEHIVDVNYCVIFYFQEIHWLRHLMVLWLKRWQWSKIVYRVHGDKNTDVLSRILLFGLFIVEKVFCELREITYVGGVNLIDLYRHNNCLQTTIGQVRRLPLVKLALKSCETLSDNFLT